MKTMTVKIRCSFCDFEITREIDMNKFGYFEIPDAYCPNDFSELYWLVDGAEEQNKT